MIQMIPVGNSRIITPGAVRNVHVNADESVMVYFVGGSCMPLKPVDGPDFCKSLLANPLFVGVAFLDSTHRIFHLSFVSQVYIRDKDGATLINFSDGSSLTFAKAEESRVVFEAIEHRMMIFNEAHMRAQTMSGVRRTASGLIIP